MVHRALKVIYPAWFYETLHCTLSCLGVFRTICAVVIGESLSKPHINSIAVRELLFYEKLDHIPSSCIVIMVNNIMVKIVNIVSVQPISHIDAGAPIAETESKNDSRSR